MTSTPSATAVSMAATRSAVEPLACDASWVDHSALYMAIRARGAMPLMVPNTEAGPVVGTPWLPPDVEDVCVPWPL